MLAGFRERAAAVKGRPLPPVAGGGRQSFIQQAQSDFMDFAIIGDATASIDDGFLVLRVDLRPADKNRETAEGPSGHLDRPVAVFAGVSGPLLVRGVDASAGTIVPGDSGWRFLPRSRRRITGDESAFPAQGRFVPGVLFGISTSSAQFVSIASIASAH